MVIIQIFSIIGRIIFDETKQSSVDWWLMVCREISARDLTGPGFLVHLFQFFLLILNMVSNNPKTHLGPLYESYNMTEKLASVNLRIYMVVFPDFKILFGI